jgi:hypothetical protein
MLLWGGKTYGPVQGDNREVRNMDKRRKLAVLILAVSSVSAWVGCDQSNMRPGALGEIDVDGDGEPDGFGYDTDGDGDADAIDTDGDGVLDGVDFGDGIILYDELGTGAEELPPELEELLIEETDPDFDAVLDPSHPPPGADDETGEVQIPPSVMLVPNELPARNQGMQGSCAAFANAAAATLVRHRRDGGDIGALWASPAFLYAFQILRSQSISSKVRCGGGTYIHTGLDTLVLEGVPRESTVPYRSARDPMICEDPADLSTRVAEAERAPYRIGGYEFIRPLSSRALKEALAGGSPIVFGTPLDEAFMRWNRIEGVDVTQTFRFSDSICEGQHCDGHAMAIVGYDGMRNAFRVLNSWGPGWGDNGYVWLDAEYFDRGHPDVYAYAVTLRPADLPPVPETPMPESFSARLMGRPVLRRTMVAGDMRYMLTVRLSLSEPLQLRSVRLEDANGSVWMDAVQQALLYGNLSMMLASNRLPVAGQPARLTIYGTLRNNQEVSASVDIPEFPEPEADPDGRD